MAYWFLCQKIRINQQSACKENSLLLLGWWILFLTCPIGKWSLLGNSNYRRTVTNPAHPYFFSFWKGMGVEMAFRLVHASYSLPESQAVKHTFFSFLSDDSIFFSWGSASDWLKQISLTAWPIRSTTQIWVVRRHQYGILFIFILLFSYFFFLITFTVEDHSASSIQFCIFLYKLNITSCILK